MAAAAAWQVAPLVELADGAPVACGYAYRYLDGWSLDVGKRLVGGAVITFIQVDRPGPLRLATASFDSDRDLRPVATSKGIRLEADLQEVDAGGMLFAELGVGGGRLWLDDAEPLELPAPLPRGVTAMYLNCAGDLIPADANP